MENIHMGKKDTVTKEYMRNPVIFADVFNQFIYQGRQVISSANLREIDTTETAVPYGTDYVAVPEQRYRDVEKLLLAMTDGRTAYCILAIENESKINYAMPVKSGLYDFMQLARQVSEAAKNHKINKTKASSDEYLSGFLKNDRLLPVVTLVVYFGADEWDGPLSLRQMYADCDEAVLKFVPDYHINLIAPYRLDDSDIDRFQTNLREVLRYIKYSKDKNKLGEILSTDDRFKSVERQAVDLINIVTSSKIKYSEGKETVDMCLAIEQLKEESEKRGEKRGELIGEKRGELIGEKRGELIGERRGELIGVVRTCKSFGLSKEKTVEHIVNEFGKEYAETEKIVSLYWDKKAN